jgi:hypothetical protein
MFKLSQDKLQIFKRHNQILKCKNLFLKFKEYQYIIGTASAKYNNSEHKRIS